MTSLLSAKHDCHTSTLQGYLSGRLNWIGWRKSECKLRWFVRKVGVYWESCWVWLEWSRISRWWEIMDRFLEISGRPRHLAQWVGHPKISSKLNMNGCVINKIFNYNDSNLNTVNLPQQFHLPTKYNSQRKQVIRIQLNSKYLNWPGLLRIDLDYYQLTR